MNEVTLTLKKVSLVQGNRYPSGDLVERCGFAVGVQWEGLCRFTLLGVGITREMTLESGLEDEFVRQEKWGKAGEQQIWQQGCLRVPGMVQGWSMGADFHGPPEVDVSEGLACWEVPQSLPGVAGRACPLCHDSWEFLPDS